jgi:DNA polymerase III delta prime subunit
MLQQLLKLRNDAPKFIKDYERREISTAVKINLYSAATDPEEKDVLSMWISNEANWLEDNREKYNKYITLQSIKPEDIESLQQLQKEIENVG